MGQPTDQQGSESSASTPAVRTLDELRAERNLLYGEPSASQVGNSESGLMTEDSVGLGSNGNSIGFDGASMSYGAMDPGYGNSNKIDEMVNQKQMAADLVQQLRARLESGKQDRKTIEKQLRSALKNYYTIDMMHRLNEFDKVKARLMDLEAKLQRRLDSESEVVELQLKQMLHKADGLDFFVPDINRGSVDRMDDISGRSMDLGLGMSSGMSMGGGMGMSGNDGGSGIGGMGGGMLSPMSAMLGYDIGHGFTGILRQGVELDDEDPLSKLLRGDHFDRKEVKSNPQKLKAILLAFHQFHMQFDHFPRSANRRNLQEPPHSWRVAILPFLGYTELYNEYRFDLPWDHFENAKVARHIPEVFQFVTQGSGDYDKTNFQMLVGGGAFDSGRAPPRHEDITDGLSNTIAVIMSDTQQVWTQPQDATYSPKAKPPSLSNDRLVALADGRVVRLPDLVDKEIHLLITRAGGEIGQDPSQFQTPE